MSATKSPAPSPRPPAPALAMAIASFAGCGYSPVAPGTAGSAAALAIAILLGWNPLWFAALAAAALVARHLGRRPRRRYTEGWRTRRWSWWTKWSGSGSPLPEPRPSTGSRSWPRLCCFACSIS